MQMQLVLDFTPDPHLQQKPVIKNTVWMDVRDVARGVGFNMPVEVGMALSDALLALQTEDDDDYDQRLYDGLWLAHHYLSLDARQSFAFTFDFLREGRHPGNITEASLRLRVEVQTQVVRIGLPQDF